METAIVRLESMEMPMRRVIFMVALMWMSWLDAKLACG